jgi:hypothetical protein
VEQRPYRSPAAQNFTPWREFTRNFLENFRVFSFRSATGNFRKTFAKVTSTPIGGVAALVGVHGSNFADQPGCASIFMPSS